MGVPHRFDESVQEQYLALLRKGTRRHRAARSLGVHPDTVSKARKRDPGFDEACVVAEQEALEDVEDKLWEAAMNREQWAVTLLLRQLDADRFGDKRKVQVEVGGVIELEAGDRLAAIARLQSELEGRRLELGPADVIDVESEEVSPVIVLET